jgi:hypothetical protein
MPERGQSPAGPANRLDRYGGAIVLPGPPGRRISGLAACPGHVTDDGYSIYPAAVAIQVDADSRIDIKTS